jgi:hypothetical protein
MVGSAAVPRSAPEKVMVVAPFAMLATPVA